MSKQKTANQIKETPKVTKAKINKIKTRNNEEDTKLEELLEDVPSNVSNKQAWVQMIQYHAMPKIVRKAMGVTNNVKEYAKQIGISELTIIRWRHRADFLSQVRDLQLASLKSNYMGDTIHQLYRRIMKSGDAAEVKLMLQLGGFLKDDGLTVTLPPEILEIRERSRKLLP